MEPRKFTVIPGLQGNGKTTLILLLTATLVLFLQGIILSDLRLYLLSLDAQLCDLRRKLAQIPLVGAPLKFTGTVSVIPEQPHKDASAQPPPRDFQTENT